jgi:hypothetical protein
MMNLADDLLSYPARPESEFEWEDLLVRVEVMCRALRVTLEEIGDGEPAVERILAGLAAREEDARRLLEDAAEVAAGRSPSLSAPSQVVSFQEDNLARFLRLRVRNFAMVQRRGIDVWDWTVRLEDGRRATVYQLLGHLAASDVETLAALRGAARGTGAC